MALMDYIDNTSTSQDTFRYRQHQYIDEHGLYYTNDIGSSNATIYHSNYERLDNELNYLRHETHALRDNINNLEFNLSQSNTKLKEEQDKLKLFIEAAGLLIDGINELK